MASKAFSNWRKIKVRDAFKITQKPPRLDWKADINIPFVPMANIREGGLQVSKFELRSAKEISSATYFEKGDFLLSKITPCFENLKQGFCDFLPKEYGFTSTEIIPIKGIDNVGAPKFLSFYLLRNGVRNDLAQKMVGTTGRQRLTKECLLNYEFLMPSLEEQKAIAKILCAIQDAMEICKKELELQRELKNSLMACLFTYGTSNESLKETEIGMIPESWSLSLLGEIVKLKSGETRPKIISEKATENYMVPVYGGNGISGYTSEVFTRKKLIVIGRVGEYCGCVHIADAPNWITDNALYSYEWFQEVDIEYFANLLSYLKLNKQRRESGQPLITQGVLSNLKIPLAGGNEQKQISEILKKQTSKINLLIKEIHLYQELFQAMLEELMTGRISTLPLVEKAELAL